jgi:hypothetical protein
MSYNGPLSGRDGVGSWALHLSSFLDCWLICQVDALAPMNTCFLPSPDLRVSFITYSCKGNIILSLTSDRQVVISNFRQAW